MADGECDHPRIAIDRIPHKFRMAECICLSCGAGGVFELMDLPPWSDGYVLDPHGENTATLARYEEPADG